ncbi:hypothetical protein Suden_1107 [Sulfurimonas denitrificans DSM 1251]|uniref:Uncharacterized protein n=1 Tax=Sulfurimonas denitrificans (strain ATCC 33889 / DSM 1251) TaxID=326298 RepID=Q30RJ6_SULDN|nr:hypothetical protein Suden_1107 [Sulfurimonas denitrificans DSM 1251]
MILEFLILATALVSFDFFINMQIASLSSFLIIAGSSYAYKKMINAQVELENIDEKRDFLDEVEDPYELYDETPINDAPAEELDLKAIVKEEKKRIKILNLKDIKKGSRASVSLFRLAPYLFLILGFVALRNNEILDIKIYLPSLFIGILAGYFISRDLSFKIKS